MRKFPATRPRIAFSKAIGCRSANLGGKISSKARELPARFIPVPDDVSEDLKKAIEGAFLMPWQAQPKTPEEWKSWFPNFRRKICQSLTVSLKNNGHDLRDPLISPIYGDMKGFPPAMIGTGTRDLFLSNSVRTLCKLREAGVNADLLV